MLWLLLTGQVPTVEQTRDLSRELAEKGTLAPHVVKLIDSCVQYLFIIICSSIEHGQLSSYSASHDATRDGRGGIEPRQCFPSCLRERHKKDRVLVSYSGGLSDFDRPIACISCKNL